MKYIWLGKHLNESLYTTFSKRGYKDPAAYSSQKNLIEGLRKIVSLETLSVIIFPPKYKKIYEKGVVWIEREKYINQLLPSLNVFLLRRLFSTSVLLVNLTKKLFKDNSSFTFFVYNLQSTLLIPLFFLKLIYYKKLKVIVIIPDLPMFMQGKMFFLKAILKSIDWLILKFLLKVVSGLVLYTSSMVEFLNFYKRPMIVIEGSANTCEFNDLITSNDELRYVLYTGKLDEIFGINIFLDAIRIIPSSITLNFLITGFGKKVKEIQKLMLQDKRVKYLGFLSRKEVLTLQSNSLINLNLRDPQNSFSKYSFPSKLFELLMAAKPIISPYLRGVPSEYYNYLNLIDNFDSTSLANKIIEILSNYNVYKKKAELGKAFIINNKNHSIQAERLLAFAQELNIK